MKSSAWTEMWRKGWPPVGTVILLLFLWQAAVSWFGIESFMLPGPLQIVTELWDQLPRISGHLSFTLEITLIGFAIGTSTGIILACILHLIPGVKQAFYPLLLLSQNIPMIALAPLLMIWFGFGLLPKVIVITLVCFFPIAVSAMDGFAQADRSIMNYMKMIGASKLQLFTKVEFPGALPSLFSGVKISATYSIMGVVIAEWLGSDKGIGVYMLLAKSSFRTDRVFVSMFIIVILSMLLFSLILLLERFMFRWKRK
ncbi:ABC transporter permease [Paenibacillus larvae]